MEDSRQNDVQRIAGEAERGELVAGDWATMRETAVNSRALLDSGALDGEQRQAFEEQVGQHLERWLDEVLDASATAFERSALTMRDVQVDPDLPAPEVIGYLERITGSVLVGLGCAKELYRLRDAWERSKGRED